MRLWYFTEQQYHPGWEKATGPIRNTPSTDVIDPKEASELFDRYYEEFAAFDEMGVNIAVNEHHASLQCMSPAPLLAIAALARVTKNVRLLSLGTPIGQRPDAVRVAEEIAMADMMSGGRTEVGFVKSVPWEHFNSNANPARFLDRFWEAAALICKALSTRNGPFHWNGEFFNYRNVNVVPTPMQQPYPPIWMAGTSASSARAIAEKGWTCVISQSGGNAAMPFFDAYREQYKKSHGVEAPRERMSYCGYLAIGRDEAEARYRAEMVHKWVESLSSQHMGFQHAAGYASSADYARGFKSGALGTYAGKKPPTIDELRERNVMFWGTPDQVYEQYASFLDRCGNVGNLLCQLGGYLSKEDTIDSMRLMKTEVWPRLLAFADRPKETATA